MSNSKNTERTFESSELASILGISRPTLFRWEKDGIIPVAPRKFKGRIKARTYTVEDVKEIFKRLGYRRKSIAKAAIEELIQESQNEISFLVKLLKEV